MTANRSTLSRTSVEAASIAYQGVRFEIEFKGVSVAGSIRLETANPKGRYLCHVNYKRRAHWTDAEHVAALRVAGHWFRDIGGIVLLQGKQMGHVIARLKKGQSIDTTERCMHWAVHVYARAEWHRTKKLWKSLGDFFLSDAFDTWLDRSDEYQRHLDDLAQAQSDRVQIDRDSLNHRTARSLPPITGVCDDDLRELHRKKESDCKARGAAEHDAGKQAYSDLDLRTRSAIIKKCQAERRMSWDEASEGPMTLAHPGFAFYVFNRTLHSESRKRGCKWSDLVGYPQPTQPYPSRTLDDEAARRVLGASYTTRVYSAAASRLIQEWLKNSKLVLPIAPDSRLRRFGAADVTPSATTT